MKYFLGAFLGSGTEENPFRAAADGYSLIDLRGDSTQQAGRCIVTTDLPSVPAGWRDLGDDLDGKLSQPIRSRFGNDLGLTVAADTPRGVIAELLLIHGRPPHDKSRWNPLRATHEGRHRIVLADQVIYDAPTIRGVSITDDFNRANETPLASPWTMAFGTGTNNLAGNLVTSTAAGVAYYRYDSTDLATDNHYAEITNVTITNNSDDYSPLVRYSSSVHTCYRGRIVENATNTAQIAKVVAGVTTNLTLSNQTAAANPWTARLTVNGSLVTLTSTDTTAITATDTEINGNVRVGFMGRNFATGQTADDFAAADLSFENPYPYIGGGYYPTQG